MGSGSENNKRLMNDEIFQYEVCQLFIPDIVPNLKNVKKCSDTIITISHKWLKVKMFYALLVLIIK